jgi:hypothetical protein
MRNDTKSMDFPQKVKQRIADRDSFDGHPCCINCGLPAPTERPTAFSNAHYISRGQGGLGIEENGLTLCPRCHGLYDQTSSRSVLRAYFREYLMDHYPGWDEEKLYYRKK